MNASIEISIGTILAFLVAVGSILTSIFTLVKARSETKDRAMKDGAKDEQRRQMAEDLEKADKRILDLERKTSCNDVDMAEIKRDLKYLVETMQKLETRIDRGAQWMEDDR